MLKIFHQQHSQREKENAFADSRNCRDSSCFIKNRHSHLPCRLLFFLFYAQRSEDATLNKGFK